MTRKSTNTTTVATVYTFAADSMTVHGRTYEARYSCTPTGHVYVFTSLPLSEGQIIPVRLHFAPEMPMYDAALKAAKAAKAAPVNPHDPTLTKAQPAAAPAAQDKPAPAKQPKAEKPAAKAEKPAAAKQPKSEPLTVANYVGKTVVGDGWKIAFDATAQRTRVTFAKDPTPAQKQAIDAAGFYWSAAMGSFNKKLTAKAFRAAMALADTLQALK